MGCAVIEKSDSMPILQWLRRLPYEKRMFATQVGLVVGTLFWLVARPQPMVNLLALFDLIMKLEFIYLGVFMLFKWGMGERWSSQHWFCNTIWFLANFTLYGIGLSAIVYDLAYYILFMKG